MYRFDEFELDLRLFELRHNGAACSIEPQVFDVLSLPGAQTNDRIVPKDELIEHVLPEKYVSEAALASRVMARGRSSGTPDANSATSRRFTGRGFRFVGNVRAEEDAATGDADNGPAGAAEADAEAEHAGCPIRPNRDGYSIALLGHGPGAAAQSACSVVHPHRHGMALGKRAQVLGTAGPAAHAGAVWTGAAWACRSRAEHFSTESRLLDLER